jgi:hypothetical protein
VEQNNNNNPNDVLWAMLANPAEDALAYAYNLQRLVNDFPQSGMLQALLVHASETKNLRQASVYFNPRSVFKLVNAPSSFVGVPDERIIIQPGIAVPSAHGNGHSYDYNESANVYAETATPQATENEAFTSKELTDTIPLEELPPLGYEGEAAHHSHGQEDLHEAEPVEVHQAEAEIPSHEELHEAGYADVSDVEAEIPLHGELHEAEAEVNHVIETEIPAHGTADDTEPIETHGMEAETPALAEASEDYLLTEQATDEVTEAVIAVEEETAHTIESAAAEEEHPWHTKGVWEDRAEEMSQETEANAEAAVSEAEHLPGEIDHEHTATGLSGEHDAPVHQEEIHEPTPLRIEDVYEHIEEPVDLHEREAVAAHPQELHEHVAEQHEEPAAEHEPEAETHAETLVNEYLVAEEDRPVVHEEHPVHEVTHEALAGDVISETEMEAEEIEPVAEIPVEETKPEPEIPLSDDLDETFDEIVGIEDIDFRKPRDSYFSFEQEFGAHEDVTAEKEHAGTTNKTIEAEQQDVSKYHDEKLPYSFLWWLDKTRKEHEQAYQPYVKAAQPPEPVGKRIKLPVDELQQQYFENIFHVTSVEDLDKSAPPPPPFAAQPPPAGGKRKEQIIIERFIKEEPQIKPQSSDKLDNENKAKKSSEDRDELVTETLAVIYSEQMLYHKAISSYKKLMLKFPEKSRYFAEKIEALEKKTN